MHATNTFKCMIIGEGDCFKLEVFGIRLADEYLTSDEAVDAAKTAMTNNFSHYKEKMLATVHGYKKATAIKPYKRLEKPMPTKRRWGL